jgi:hypothetical protein
MHGLTNVQNEQRQRRRDEVATGTPWQLRHFLHVETDPDCTPSSLFPICTDRVMNRRSVGQHLQWIWICAY